MWVKVNLDKKTCHPYLLNLDTGARIYCEEDGVDEINWTTYKIYYEELNCDNRLLLNVVWVGRCSEKYRAQSPLNIFIDNIFKKIKLGEHFEI